MSQFSVDTRKLGEFFKICELFSTDRDIKLALTVNPTAMSVLVGLPSAINPSVLMRSSFGGKFEDWGEIGIATLLPLKKFLLSKSTPEAVFFKKDENKLYCAFDRSRFSVQLCDPKQIKNKIDDQSMFQKAVDEAHKGASFVIKPECLRDIKRFSGSMGAKSLLLFGKDGSVSIKISGYQQEAEINVDPTAKIETPFEIELGSEFITILDKLKKFEILANVDVAAQILYLKLNSKEMSLEFIFRAASKSGNKLRGR